MNWIGIITNLLTAVLVIVSLLIVLLVLLQRPKDQGLGAAFGGDTASNIFGAQTTNVLATLTRWLGSIFLILCLLIAVLGTHDVARQGKIKVYLDRMKQEQAERDKAKAAEEAAKAASAAADSKKQLDALPTATSAPVQVPPTGNTPVKVDDKKPAAPVPTAPAPSAPKPEAKPANVNPSDAKPADKPVDPKPAGGN
jgi:preprotein translocase subunit SecG